MSLDKLKKKYGVDLKQNTGSALAIDRSGNKYFVEQDSVPKSANRVKKAALPTASPSKGSSFSASAGTTAEKTSGNLGSPLTFRSADRAEAQRRISVLSQRRQDLLKEKTGYEMNAETLTPNLSRYQDITRQLKQLNDELSVLDAESRVYKAEGTKREDTFLGQTLANYDVGRLSQDSSMAWNEYMDNPTEANRKRAQLLDEAMKRYQVGNAAALDDENVKASWISKTFASNAAQQVDQVKAQIIGGLGGLAVGGVAGARVGASAVSGLQSYQTMRGAAFKRLLDLGVDEQSAKDLATDEGFISGLIEGADTYLDWLLFGTKKTVSAVSSLVSPQMAAKVSTSAGKSALAKVAEKVSSTVGKSAAGKAVQAVGSALGKAPGPVKAVAGYALNIPQEGAEESLQEGVSIAADKASQSNARPGLLQLAGNSLQETLSPENREQVAQAGVEGMKFAAMAGALHTAVNRGVTYAASRAAGAGVDTGQGVDYTENETPVSPAAAENVQELHQQGQTVKEGNPQSTVLGAAETLIMERQGVPEKVARKRAEIIRRLVDGDETLTPKDLNPLEPTHPLTRQVFTELTGVQFPEGKLSPEQLFNAYKSAHEVAQSRIEQNQVEQAMAETEILAAEKEARAAETASTQDWRSVTMNAESKERLDAAMQDLTSRISNLDIGPDGNPMVSLSDFAARYREAVNPTADHAEVQRQYQAFRSENRTVSFGGHRLTRAQFGQLIREQSGNGSNLTDAQIDALFNQAILDTLDGSDGFDRYTAAQPQATGSRVKHSRNGLELSNGTQITRDQFKAFMRDYYAQSGRETTDDGLDAMFDVLLLRADQGERMPYSEAMAPYLREEDGKVGGQGDTQNRGDVRGSVQGRDGLVRDGGLRRETGAHPGEQGQGVAGRAGGAAEENGARGDSRSQDVRSAGDRGDQSQDSRAQGEEAGRGTADQADGDVKVYQPKPAPNQAFAEALRKKVSGKRSATREIPVGGGIRPVTALSRRYYTKSFREVESKLTRADSKMVAVMGRIRTEDGITADGVTLRDQGLTLVQADSNSRTFMQLGKHEVMHNYVNADAEIRQQAWQRAIAAAEKNLSEQELEAVIRVAYVNSHGKAYGDFKKNKWAYREEFLADLYGGLNDRAHLDQETFDILSRAVNETVEQWEADWDSRQQDQAAEIADQQDQVAKENSDSIGDRVFSMTTERSWAEQVRRIDELDSRSALYIEETPNLLAEVGLGDLPLCMTKMHVENALHAKDPSNIRWHGVSEETVSRLPELLSKPVMILDSFTVPGDIVVVLDAQDTDGLPLVAAIHPNGNATVDGERGPANFITSLYGRSNFAPPDQGYGGRNNFLYLALANRSVLYWDQKRTEALAQRARLHLPAAMYKVPSDTILRDYQGYVKENIPDRVFSTTVEESIPQFQNWNQAYFHFEAPDSVFGFSEPPMPGIPEMEFGVVEGNQFKVLATFPATPAGLEEFNHQAETLLQYEVYDDTLLTPDEIDELGDIGGEDSFSDEGDWKSFLSSLPGMGNKQDLWTDEDFAAIHDDSTSFGDYDPYVDHSGDPWRQQDMSLSDEDIARQQDREGFTSTKTRAFKRWFHDDSGELTNPDGQPKILWRGTPWSGTSKMRNWHEANSSGFFFTPKVKVAEAYAAGVTQSDDRPTPMDRAKGQYVDGGNNPDTDFQNRYLRGWKPVQQFLKQYFQSPTGKGIRLLPIGDDGEQTAFSRATGFKLQTNLNTRDQRRATGRTYSDWRDLGQWEKSKEGLDQFNRDFGDIIRQNELGIRASAKYYLSATNTLVIDAEGADYHAIPEDVLPGDVQSGHETGSQSINGLVERAWRAGYDCVVFKNVFDEGGIQNQYVVKDGKQIKSVYNKGTWDPNDPDFKFSVDVDAVQGTSGNADLDAFIRSLEQEYGEGSSQKMFDAFVNLRASRASAARAAGQQPSIGAADAGFDPYSRLQNEYGTVEPGEKPARAVDMPQSTTGQDRVSRTARTVMEARATPDSRIPSIEDAVVDRAFSYTPGVNKIQANRATQKIKRDGWNKTLTDWTAAVRSGQVNADLVALGAVMLNNAGNADMDGGRYVNLLVDYTNLLRSAGQATQAARILKNLTPEGRLYAIQGYVSRMNERLRGGDPESNIPVEQWMQKTGENLAQRLQKSAGGSRKKAQTTAQIILSDLNRFAQEAFPEKEKTQGRTELDRLQDLFDNYDHYQEAWEAAKQTIQEQYADDPEALSTFEKWLDTDLKEAFLGRYFGVPEIRIRDDLADRFIQAKTDTDRDAVLDEIYQNIADQIPATKMEKFTALRYLNMLGNLKTQGRNIVGNAFNLGLTKAKNTVATTMELALRAAGVKVERTKSFTRDKATYLAAKQDFENVRQTIMSGGKYQDNRRFSDEIESRRRIFKNRVLESYRRATNYAMDQGDVIFSRTAYADALSRYLKANGATFETAGQDLLDKARLYAIQQAAEATFRDSNAFSDAISGMRFRNPDTWAKKGINLLGEGLLPFRKTPANILVRATEYSPVGFLTTAAGTIYGAKKTGTVDGSKLIDGLAKNLTGTAILALGYYLAENGLLRGKDPEDDKEKGFDDLTGHQAYSLELPNGLSLTLDWLAPSSIPLFLGAQIADAAAEDGLSFRDVLTAISAISDPMLQMSMLQGVDDALKNASTYGDDSALARFTGNALWSFFTQGLTNTMLGQLERSFSEYRSTTYRDKNKDLPDGLQYLLGKTAEKIPGYDYGQIPYIDAWGRMEKNAPTMAENVFNQFLNPSYVSRVDESDMEQELRRLYDETQNSSVLISRPKAYFTVNNERVDLTAEQYVEYATTRGQTAYSIATDLTESPAYESLSDAQKAEAVIKAYDFANAVGKAQATGYPPEKWSTDPPEGAAVPESWVMKAAEDAADYGIPVSSYVTVYAATKDLESIKDENGETVDNSLSLQTAAVIHGLGLSKAQTDKLLEDFNVNKTVRGYSGAMVNRKLSAMKQKYQ